jgi:hypothetical protein
MRGGAATRGKLTKPFRFEQRDLPEMRIPNEREGPHADHPLSC